MIKAEISTINEEFDLIKGRGPDKQLRRRRHTVGDSVRHYNSRNWQGQWVPTTHRGVVTKVNDNSITVKDKTGKEREYPHKLWVEEK